MRQPYEFMYDKLSYQTEVIISVISRRANSKSKHELAVFPGVSALHKHSGESCPARLQVQSEEDPG